MTNEEVRIIASEYYDLKCQYYRVFFREKCTKLEFEEYKGMEITANKIAELMTWEIFNYETTPERDNMAEMFRSIEILAREIERKERNNNDFYHKEDELNYIFKSYGFWEESQ